MHFNPKKDFKRIVLIILGSCLFAFNVNTFINTADLLPGGAAGLSLLLQSIFKRFAGVNVPYTALSLTINAIPVYIGFRYLGKKFTLLSCLAILLMSVLSDMLPGVVITSEPILLSIFGGILNGTAISMCLLAGATSGGTDFISIYMSEQHGKDSFNYIFAINVVILSLAGLLFSWERALYSIIFQFASTQVIHLLYKRYQQQTLLIITEHPDEIYGVIRELSHHGATLFKGTGLYEQKERTMVYSVISADEVTKVIAGVRAADPKAFINSIRTNSLTGNFYRRPND